MTNIVDFFSQDEKAKIKEAVQNAENQTSGEIRLHLEAKCKGEVLDRAVFIFHKIGMSNTALKNGVLFYLSISDRKFAIIGDEGINNQVENDFWNTTKEVMLGHFAKGNVAEGVIDGINMAGEKLKTHFPYQKDDKNELSDDISYS